MKTLYKDSHQVLWWIDSERLVEGIEIINYYNNEYDKLDDEPDSDFINPYKLHWLEFIKDLYLNE